MKVLETTKAPGAIGPYSQGFEVNGFVFTSGQIPVNPATGTMPESIEEQATQALTNLKNVLAAAGLTTGNVIKTVVFLADLNDFPVVNRIYESFFSAPYPARSCVQVAGIPKGAKIEIECIAVNE